MDDMVFRWLEVFDLRWVWDICNIFLGYSGNLSHRKAEKDNIVMTVNLDSNKSVRLIVASKSAHWRYFQWIVVNGKMQRLLVCLKYIGKSSLKVRFLDLGSLRQDKPFSQKGCANATWSLKWFWLFWCTLFMKKSYRKK